MANWLRGFLIVCFALAAGYAGGQESDAASQNAARCGTQPISIARLQWPSAAVLAHVHASILKAQFGCEVTIVAGDLHATSSSMATSGQPAVAPELWVARVADVWNGAVEAQQVRRAGNSFSGGALEGWFVPDFVAANHGELTSTAVLKDYWQVFRLKGEKAQFISCPPDWACAVINRNLLRALGLDDLFEIIEPANRFEMDTLIGEAMSKRDPILFYYWQPNAVLAQFKFKALNMGAYDPEALACLARRSCGTPVPSGFTLEPVVAALAEWVFVEAPAVAGYFQRASMPLDEMNALLAWQSEGGRSAEEVAAHFVDTRIEVWQAWVGAL